MPYSFCFPLSSDRPHCITRSSEIKEGGGLCCAICEQPADAEMIDQSALDFDDVADGDFRKVHPVAFAGLRTESELVKSIGFYENVLGYYTTITEPQS